MHACARTHTHTHPHTHTHTHKYFFFFNHCSRNWGLILVGGRNTMRRGRFSDFALINDRVEQYLRSFWGRITNEGSEAKESAKYHESCVSVHQSCLSTSIQLYAELSVIFLDNVLLFADTAWDFHDLEVILLIGVGKHHQEC